MTQFSTHTQPQETAEAEGMIRPMIIAGPCSAETEEQVMATARGLKDQEISYFRAGIWKPRTRPGSFAGVGEEGLAWLKRVKDELGMKVTTEVANAQHVESALKAGVDLLWIGARTTANPFTVQEIADALTGVEVPVMVKNPINPDLDLWVGAIERIMRAGVKDVVTCHRGFNVYGKSKFRNQPLWEIPIEMRRRMPDLPMICDPSHICGTRDLLADISQKALDLGYEGLMIETHPDPDKAWSDAKQQITPNTLLELITNLRFKQHSTTNTEYLSRILHLRDEIDEADIRLLALLADRMEVSRQIGELKEENNLPFYAYDRWSEIIRNVSENAEVLGMSKEFVLKLFSLIHLESIDIQGE